MNINYLRLDRHHLFDRRGDAQVHLATDEFYLITGMVDVPEADLTSSSAAQIVATVHAVWTFPLRFAEIVWGDGRTTHREVISMAETREFGSERLDVGPCRRMGCRGEWRVREPVLAAVIVRSRRGRRDRGNGFTRSNEDT